MTANQSVYIISSTARGHSLPLPPTFCSTTLTNLVRLHGGFCRSLPIYGCVHDHVIAGHCIRQSLRPLQRKAPRVHWSTLSTCNKPNFISPRSIRQEVCTRKCLGERVSPLRIPARSHVFSVIASPRGSVARAATPGGSADVRKALGCCSQCKRKTVMCGHQQTHCKQTAVVIGYQQTPCKQKVVVIGYLGVVPVP